MLRYLCLICLRHHHTHEDDVKCQLKLTQLLERRLYLETLDLEMELREFRKRQDKNLEAAKTSLAFVKCEMCQTSTLETLAWPYMGIGPVCDKAGCKKKADRKQEEILKPKPVPKHVLRKK